MRLNGRIAALLVLLAVGVAACGGNPAPEPPPVVAETVPQPDADSLAAVRAAERAAAAARLCNEAAAAMAAGDYDRARSLYQQAQRDYAGTDCANTAGGQLAMIDAVMVIRERVHFDFDKSNIRDDAAAVLQAKADVLRKYPNVKLTIEGHCDERGSIEYNQALGQRRADNTVRYLVSLGLSADMFNTVSYGKERPIAQGSNEDAWQANRRAEFVIENMGAL
ncbi:MAG: peptidoglycan-associated lipoprotein Pal [Candidatus Palauibacterales bacterium]|jgi:peptidoglycan-associated lipoprotein|nr:peptidoglycan-associated lipoprotein Pal [Candidatus Palauibacterales bacterium]